MASERNDGGPAFPCHDLSQYGLGPATRGDQFAVHGMTLRDWFAGQALVGVGQWVPYPATSLADAEGTLARSRWAYQQADAMLAAREAGR